MLISTFPIIGVGFTLGLMHALDADHVMAVSALSASKPSLKTTLSYSFQWALGHGSILLVSGALLFGVGLHIPEQLQVLAEALVGVLLIVLGVWCVWRFKTQGVSLQLHQHGHIEHLHWSDQKHGEELVCSSHNSEKTPGDKPSGNHAPVMVGILHGLAGSAPALALVPAVAEGNMWMAMIYLILFSLGVMLSMLCFGTGLGGVQRYLKQHYQRVFLFSRYVIALGSISLGCFWLSQAI